MSTTAATPVARLPFVALATVHAVAIIRIPTPSYSQHEFRILTQGHFFLLYFGAGFLFFRLLHHYFLQQLFPGSLFSGLGFSMANEWYLGFRTIDSDSFSAISILSSLYN